MLLYLISYGVGPQDVTMQINWKFTALDIHSVTWLSAILWSLHYLSLSSESNIWTEMFWFLEGRELTDKLEQVCVWNEQNSIRSSKLILGGKPAQTWYFRAKSNRWHMVHIAGMFRDDLKKKSDILSVL